MILPTLHGPFDVLAAYSKRTTSECETRALPVVVLFQTTYLVPKRLQKSFPNSSLTPSFSKQMVAVVDVPGCTPLPGVFLVFLNEDPVNSTIKSTIVHTFVPIVYS